MNMRSIGLSLTLLVFGQAYSVPMASANTTWTNVSPSEVITGVWSDDGNWSDGKPGVEIAYLTNSMNSYVVNYNTTDTAYNGGGLYMNQAALSPTNVTLNINATMGEYSGGKYCVLKYQGYRAIVNVNNGGTWNVLDNETAASLYGYLFVNDGGTVNMNYGNANQLKRMKILVASNAAFNGSYAITPGGWLTVEEGGVYSGTDLLLGDRWASGTAAVTNRGSITATRYLKLAGSMQYTDRDAVFSMEGGVARFGTSAASDYGLEISLCVNGTYYGTWAGEGNFVMSGGVVTNYVLQVGCSEYVGTITGWKSANGFLTIEDGSFWNLQHALIGGFPTTIAAGSVDNAANNLRGTVNQSGGSFRSLGHVYVANGPSTGTLNLSGGTFTVSNNGGSATLYLGANEGANVNLVGKGSINLTGGYLAVDRLVATNGAVNSVIDFKSGTMEIREAADVGAGTVVTVGDGVSSARLVLGDGSASAFAAGLAINTNALLDIGGTSVIGAASVTGNLTLTEGARLAWTFNSSDQDLVTLAGDLQLPSSATVELNGLDASKPAVIPLMTVTGAISGSPALWPKSEVNGRRYRADVADGTLQMVLLPQGTLIHIR